MHNNDNNNDDQALFDAIGERVRARRPHLTPRAWADETIAARDSQAFQLDGFGLRVAEPRRLADAGLNHLLDDYTTLQQRADMAHNVDMGSLANMMGQPTPARREGETADDYFTRCFGAPLESWL